MLAGRSKGVHLDETGSEQATDAAARLEGLPLAAVVTSPLERCRETARLLARGRRAVPADRRLTECDYGSWTGRPLKELGKEPLWRTVQAHPAGAVFPDGEAMAEMRRARWPRSATGTRVSPPSTGADAVWVAVSPRRRDQGDPGRRARHAPRLVPADHGRPGEPLGGALHAELRPFVLTMNTSSGSLAHLGHARAEARPRGRRTSSDAVVGALPGTP